MTDGAGDRSRPLRVLIVDDEPLARRGVRARLARLPGIEIVAECAGGHEAIASIRRLAPDVVFLDVQMPETDGFAVVREVGPERMPLVVFVTAYDAHALRAFEAHAADYLLKPIDDERFLRAVERARARAAERRAADVVRRLSAVLAAVGAGDAPAAAPPPEHGRILVRDRGRVLILDPDEIDWVEAERDYVCLHVRGRRHLLRETMGAMEDRLASSRFVRVHRSYLVNAARVRELRPVGREYAAVLRDGTELKVSRGYLPGLQDALAAAR